MADLNAQFKLTTFTSRRAGKLGVLTMDNGFDHTKPTIFGEGALSSLHAALDQIEADENLRGILLTGKHFIFAVGADLDSFIGRDADFARQGGEAGHAAFARLMALPITTVAAINGACMGGGMEIALHCDARTLNRTAAALAFPEVFLNIFPAWGGTQLAPRVVGAADAIQSIITDPMNNNRVMKPQVAFDRGFADRMFEPATFLDDSIAFLEDLVTGEVTLERDVDPTEGLDEALTNARAFIEAKVHGATPAPSIALDLIEFAARGGDLEEGRRREQDGLVELLPANAAQASIYAFNLTQQRVKRQPWRPDAAPRRIRKVAVIGAGLMGAQLGALFLQRLEVPLVMKDLNEEVLTSAREHIEGAVDQRLQKGRMSAGKASFLKGLVTYTTTNEELADADWVIEAVLERMGLKQAIFADLETVVAPDAILATNTSSLSIAEMASELEHPERVVGFHFFNPVAVLPLVEVINHEAASDEAMATAFDVAKKLGKSAVGCNDAPAFIVNRMLTRFNSAATSALAQGNSFQEIDDAIKGLGLPMGPFELFGLVGIQVAFHTAETLEEAFGDRYAIDQNFRAIASIEGLTSVYDWGNGGQVDSRIQELVEVDPDATPLTADQIRTRALEAAADEARHMLDDGVVADARDIDTGMIFGAGFPFFMGGLCKHLDQVGISDRLFGAPLITPEDQAA